MSARHKLNAASIHGIVIVAGIIAALTESWMIFCLVIIVLIFTALVSGDIRLGGRRRR